MHIVQNAINLAHALGVAKPNVAILSAVENINLKIPSTLEAAVLCKMADRGQITGGVLDEPLAFDNAISAGRRQNQGIDSPVAGAADILLVPDLESGNMLAKKLSFLANADAAGIVMAPRCRSSPHQPRRQPAFAPGHAPWPPCSPQPTATHKARAA